MSIDNKEYISLDDFIQQKHPQWRKAQVEHWVRTKNFGKYVPKYISKNTQTGKRQTVYLKAALDLISSNGGLRGDNVITYDQLVSLNTPPKDSGLKTPAEGLSVAVYSNHDFLGDFALPALEPQPDPLKEQPKSFSESLDDFVEGFQQDSFSKIEEVVTRLEKSFNDFVKEYQDQNTSLEKKISQLATILSTSINPSAYVSPNMRIWRTYLEKRLKYIATEMALLDLLHAGHSKEDLSSLRLYMFADNKRTYFRNSILVSKLKSHVTDRIKWLRSNIYNYAQVNKLEEMGALELLKYQKFLKAVEVEFQLDTAICRINKPSKDIITSILQDSLGLLWKQKSAEVFSAPLNIRNFNEVYLKKPYQRA